MRESEVEPFAESVRAAIGEQIEAAIDALEGGDFQSAIDEAGSALRSAYRAAWTRVYVLFAGRTYDAIDAATKSHGPDHVTKWEQLVDEFLQGNGGRRIVNVDQTTKDFVQSIVRDSIAEGLGIPETRKAIREAWASVSNTRAERIARTEIVGASNAGSLQGAKDIASDVGLDLRKKWLATLDGRTRTFPDDEYSHVRVNGQTVGLDEQFQVPRQGGPDDALDHPGDPKGSPGNIIQCRCTVIYEEG